MKKEVKMKIQTRIFKRLARIQTRTVKWIALGLAIIFVLMLTAGIFGWRWPLGIILIVLGGMGIFFASGLRKVPAIPPHIGVILRRGRIIGKTRKAGWTWVFPIKYFEDIEYINIEKKNVNLPAENIRCKDLAELGIAVSYTWAPDPQNIIAYINSGREEGITNILEDIIRQEIRQFTINLPYEKVLATTDEMIQTLLQVITGVEKKEAVEKLRKERELHDMGALGIIIYRLNIPPIQIKGELAKAAEKKTIEERERAAEVFETDTDLTKAKALTEMASQFKQEISIPQAFEMIMNYKAVREGQGRVWIIPGLSEIPGMIKGFKKILEREAK